MSENSNACMFLNYCWWWWWWWWWWFMFDFVWLILSSGSSSQFAFGVPLAKAFPDYPSYCICCLLQFWKYFPFVVLVLSLIGNRAKTSCSHSWLSIKEILLSTDYTRNFPQMKITILLGLYDWFCFLVVIIFIIENIYYLDKFQISLHDRCGGLWNTSTSVMLVARRMSPHMYILCCFVANYLAKSVFKLFCHKISFVMIYALEKFVNQ